MDTMEEALFQCHFKADFLVTVIPRMYALLVEYLGPGVRYNVHLCVI